MKHGSLFSGIGGFDLAAEWMGWENIFHCEINTFGQQILNYHFPNAISYADIKKTNFSIHRGEIDIITGGFPCQPFSMAGKRKGKDDPRHLWPEMLRVIRQVQPGWVVGENVYGIVNWDRGLVFDEVQADLEAEGYEVQPVILPACAVGAPHRRDRTWFVAHRLRNGRIRSDGKNEIEPSKRGIDALNDVEHVLAANTNNIRLERIDQKKKGKQSAFRNAWIKFPTQPTVCSGNDGLSDRLDGITFPKWRNESIKAYGNAIVPQVAFEIFKVISKYELLNPLK
jgi:DNA (cytosine-5)-methyltransferase 1